MSAVVEQKTHELPFYLIQTKRYHWRIFNPLLSADQMKLLKAQKANTLREMFPKYERPIAAQFITRHMIEDTLWAETDDNGELATDDPQLAAYVITQAKKLNPKARFHNYSKKLTQEQINEELAKLEKALVGVVPQPRPYNLKPKNQLVVKE